ncbi:MAG TPA: hypothetical protein VD995_26345 [Azospirillum sp.]|nr:hypothetical protein [Azospirillum sp.]
MLRVHALAAAVVLYGFLSWPAPPEVRVVEVTIAALLAATAGVARPWAVVSGQVLHRPDTRPWETVAALALAALLWPPLARGLALGAAPADVLRDVVPLFYLFLPVLLVPVLRRAGPRAVTALAAALALAGVLFALRWWRQVDWGFGAVGTRAMTDGARYFLNAPSVLFAGIALPAAALGLAARGGVWRWGLAMLLLVPAALCLGALAGAVHRMALGLAVLAFAAMGAWWLRRRPWLVLGCAGMAAVLLLPLPDGSLSGAVHLVAEKSRLTGANARVEEAMAVLEQVGGSPLSLLIGDGWGALIANPAVGGWRVSYTHTLLSYALMKAGLLGFAALLAYLMGLVPAALALLRGNPLLAWAVLPPLAMALGLHTSFKYLDCGLLLTLLVLAADMGEGKPSDTG